MCLLLTAFKFHPDYPLIIAANRDEFHARHSPIFIKGTDFGTRCSTVILINSDGTIHFLERTFSPEGAAIKTVQYKFVYRS